MTRTRARQAKLKEEEQKKKLEEESKQTAETSQAELEPEETLTPAPKKQRTSAPRKTPDKKQKQQETAKAVEVEANEIDKKSQETNESKEVTKATETVTEPTATVEVDKAIEELEKKLQNIDNTETVNKLPITGTESEKKVILSDPTKTAEEIAAEEAALAAAEAEAIATVVSVPKKPKEKKIKEKKKGNKSKNADSEDDDFDDDTEDSDDDDYEDVDEEDIGDSDEDTENKNDMNGSVSLNGSALNVSSGTPNKKKEDGEKLRRRLPLSIKELIDYHSSNGKSIKEIVTRINQVCRPDEKVSYGYVQKYLYRKKLEATTAKKARYYRKKYGFVYRRMRRKPVLTDNHRASRIAWCESHVGDKFDKDIFIGKTALKPFLASLNQLKGQPADPNQPKQQTTLHLWGAISRRGASPLQIFDGALTTAMYLEILLENVVPFIAENFPEGHRFHQDNNPKHSAKLSQEFLESTGINWVKSPPRSHDLNPIELVWTDLIQVVAKRLPKTIGQVVIAVKEYWKTLTPEKCSEFIDKLCDIVPKVVEKKGEWVSIS